MKITDLIIVVLAWATVYIIVAYVHPLERQAPPRSVRARARRCATIGSALSIRLQWRSTRPLDKPVFGE